LAFLSVELGIPPSELLRRMTLRDYMLLIRYFGSQVEDEKQMPQTPADLMRGF
jgi:hypothetical protein